VVSCEQGNEQPLCPMKGGGSIGRSTGSNAHTSLIKWQGHVSLYVAYLHSNTFITWKGLFNDAVSYVEIMQRRRNSKKVRIWKEVVVEHCKILSHIYLHKLRKPKMSTCRTQVWTAVATSVCCERRTGELTIMTASLVCVLPSIHLQSVACTNVCTQFITSIPTKWCVAAFR
jgi:hypothetical protein